VVGDGRHDVIDTGPPRRRLSRVVVVVLGVVLGVSVVALLAEGGSPAPPPPSPPPPSATVAPGPTFSRIDARPNVLHPKTRKVGEATRAMDVTFPDGSRARLTYPADLRLEELGVRPFTGVMDTTPSLYAMYAPRSGEAELAVGGKRLRRLADGVDLWQRGDDYVTAFTFGRWLMAIDDPYGHDIVFEARMALAENIDGEVDEDGFLILSAAKPLRLIGPGEVYAGKPLGPQLWFGHAAGPLVVVAPTPSCDETFPVPAIVAENQKHATACKGDFLVAAAGPGGFAERATRRIEVRGLD